MANEQHLGKGGAALGAVEQGHRPLNAQERQRRPQRLTLLEGVNGHGLAAGDDLGGRLPTSSPPLLQGMGVRGLPRGHTADGGPHGAVQGFVQFLCHFHQAPIPGVGVVALLVHMQKGNAGLEGGVLVAAPGDQQIGLGFLNYPQQFLRPPLFHQDAVGAKQGFDAGFVGFGAFAGAGGNDLDAQVLGR